MASMSVNITANWTNQLQSSPTILGRDWAPLFPLALLCCVLKSHFRLTGIMRRFFSCSMPVHWPISSRGKSFSLRPPLAQWPQLLALLPGYTGIFPRPVFLGFPVLLDLRKFEELSSTELPCDPKMAGRIFRLKSNHQIPTESLFSSSSATLPLQPASGFFPWPTHTPTIVSSGQTQLISN